MLDFGLAAQHHHNKPHLPPHSKPMLVERSVSVPNATQKTAIAFLTPIIYLYDELVHDKRLKCYLPWLDGLLTNCEIEG